MSEEINDLQEFVNLCQLRLSIALAFALIRNKDCDEDTECYVRYIQSHFVNNLSLLSVERSSLIGNLQKKALIEVLSSFPGFLDEKVSFSDDLVKKTEEIFDLPDIVVRKECFQNIDLSFVDKTNASFVHLMVKLQYAVEHLKSIKLQPTGGSMIGDDSGFESTVTSITCKSVSSSIIRRVICTNYIEDTINASLDGLLKCVSNVIETEPERAVKGWQGSLLENYVNIINQSAEVKPEFAYIVSDCLNNLIRQFSQASPGMESGLKLYHQMWLLKKFLVVDNVSNAILNYLLIEMTNMSSALKSSCPLIAFKTFALAEALPRIIELALHLILDWKNRQKNIFDSKYSESTNETVKVANLWKIKWMKDKSSLNVSSSFMESRSDIVESFLSIIKTLLFAVTDKFPLLTYRLSHIINLLEND